MKKLTSIENPLVIVRPSFKCKIEGCELRGTTGYDTQSGMYCHYHDQAHPSDYDKITSAIRRNQHIHLLMQKCMRPYDYYKGNREMSDDDMAYQEVCEQLTELGLEDLIQKNTYKMMYSINHYLKTTWTQAPKNGDYNAKSITY